MKIAGQPAREDLLVSHLPTFMHIDEVARWAPSACQIGVRSAPRGQPTLEIFAQGFTLVNPRNRLVSLRHRRWNAALAVGEFCWHMSARDDVDPLAYYAPIWRVYSENSNNIRGSCYGKKIFHANDGEKSSWAIARDFLQSDSETRRAVISVGGYDVPMTDDVKDISCLQTLHFFIRNSKLHMITHMRSNDAFIGLPYDIFLFSMFQEIMCAELEIDIGNYIHIADSLHIYERDLDKYSFVINNESPSKEMGKIQTLNDLPLLLDFEERLRVHKVMGPMPSTEPWNEMAQILVRFHNSNNGRV